MRNINCLGIIFSNTGDDTIPELTALRTMGSVPFGCRYRVIDFALSSFVNADITKVGLITKRNFRSLSDHVGSGRSWDLARKKGGLFMLSPYASASITGIYKGKIDALVGCLDFIENSTEEYIVLSDANVIANVDIGKMMDQHLETGADITVAYKKDIVGAVGVEFASNKIANFIDDVTITSKRDCSLGYYLLKKDLLISLIKEANLHNYTDFTVDVLQRNAKDFNILGFEVTSYASVINSMQQYFDSNMDLLNKDTRDAVFNMELPVFTKLRDDMPSRYGFDSKVSDSLIADGCLIEGTVKNSIIFRGVHIAKGAVVENCILMQSAKVGEGTNLSYVISDKNVTFKDGRTLVGCHSFPLVIGKGLTV